MSGIAGTGACSFGGITFFYSRPANGGLPIWPKEAVISEEHIPGGTTDVVQNMGVKSTSSLSILIGINSANFTSLSGMVGTQASCTIVGNAARQAIFKGFKGEKVFQGGFWRVTADFLGL